MRLDNVVLYLGLQRDGPALKISYTLLRGRSFNYLPSSIDF